MRALAIIVGQQVNPGNNLFPISQHSGSVSMNSFDDLRSAVSEATEDLRGETPIILQAFDSQHGRPIAEMIILSGSEDDESALECFINQVSVAIDEEGI